MFWLRVRFCGIWFISPVSEKIAVVNRDSFRRPTSSSGRDGTFMSSGTSDIPSIEKKSFVQLMRIRLVNAFWGNVPSVPMTPPASPNSLTLFFSTLMFIPPGLASLPISRTVTFRDSWRKIARTRSIFENVGSRRIELIDSTKKIQI